MPEITFIHRNGKEQIVQAPSGLSIMEVARKEGLNAIEGACGGSLACATCHVIVHPDWVNRVLPDTGEISEAEEDMLDMAFDLQPTSRLSCQIIVTDALDGLVLALPGAKTGW